MIPTERRAAEVGDVRTLDDVPRDRALCVYGAGSGGGVVLRTLMRAGGYKVIGVFDRSKTGMMEGVEIFHPDEIAAVVGGEEAPVILLASEYHEEMRAELVARGISGARNALPLIEHIVETDDYENGRRWLDSLRLGEMIVDISASCNARCPFCPRTHMPIERAKGYMDRTTYLTALAEAEKAGIRRIRLFSTGEPLLHPDFPEFVDLATERGFLLNISTNAHNLHRYRESLMKVDSIQFSIDGWDKDSYEYMRRPLLFENTLRELGEFDEAVRKRDGRKPRRSINFHVTRDTDVEAAVALWGRYADEIGISPAYPPQELVGGRIARRVDEERLKNALFPTARLTGFLRCPYPFSVVSVAFDGRIVLCCSDFHAAVDFGHISDGIENVFASTAMRAARAQFFEQEFPICGECSAFYRAEPAEELLRIRDLVRRLAEKTERPRIVVKF